MLTPEEIKLKTGRHAASFVKNGMVIGLGTGSTVYGLILELGQRVREGLQFSAVPTSTQTANLARDAGIQLTDLDNADRLTIAIDGADEIDPAGQLIKGGGGALLQEKIVAAAADKLIIIADPTKLVRKLGRFPLPIEVIPFGHRQVMQQVRDRNIARNVVLRIRDGKPFISDHGHYILDCHCETIEDAPRINRLLKDIPGVVETGLFIGMADEAIIGQADGTMVTQKW